MTVNTQHTVGALQILTNPDNDFADDGAGNLVQYDEREWWEGNKDIKGRVIG